MLDEQILKLPVLFFPQSDKVTPLGIWKIKVFPYTRKAAYQTKVHMEDKGFSYIVKNAPVA